MAMTDAILGLVAEAKKNKLSAMTYDLSDEDVIQIWKSVSEFIEKQMVNHKGVQIHGLGTFTFSQKKLEIGNNRYLHMQRPVFILSEKFAQTHGLGTQKRHVEGNVPVVQLNFTTLAYELPFHRDLVERCIKEVLLALSRSVADRKNIEFTFCGIGRLQIRDSKVKMKFYKEFINLIDGSGKLVDSMKDRPGTVDSVISDRCTPSRPLTGTCVLPKIGSNGLSLGGQDASMPTICEEPVHPQLLHPQEQVHFEEEAREELPAHPINTYFEHPQDFFDTGMEVCDRDVAGDVFSDDGKLPNEPCPSPGLIRQLQYSRTMAPMAVASGVHFDDELMGAQRLLLETPNHRRSLSNLQLPVAEDCASNGANFDPEPTPDFRRSKTMDQIHKPSPPPSVTKQQPSSSRCGHKNAGQELCYLCHQRDHRNVPMDLTQFRKQRDTEEDILLRTFQTMKKDEALIMEGEERNIKRLETQKMAAFNLGVADALNSKKMSRSVDFYPSYVLADRPYSPSHYVKQQEYHTALTDQLRSKEDLFKKRKADEEFLERLEQSQLAEDLAGQRRQYLKDRKDQKEEYKRALSTQIRYKPEPMPAMVPNSTEPYFGRTDMKNEILAEQRRQAHQLFRDQMGTVEQRKRDALLNRLAEQKEEEKMLQRTRQDLINDNVDTYERMFRIRKQLEADWHKSRDKKKLKELEDKEQGQMLGLLVHEQCDKYQRCGQCKRRPNNCGETNLWRDSHYIAGSRIML